MPCLFSWYFLTVSNMWHNYYYNSRMVKIFPPGYEYLCVEGFRICFNVYLDSSWFCPLIFRLCNRCCSRLECINMLHQIVCSAWVEDWSCEWTETLTQRWMRQKYLCVFVWWLNEQHVFLMYSGNSHMRLIDMSGLTCHVNKLLENQPSDFPVVLSISLQM